MLINENDIYIKLDNIKSLDDDDDDIFSIFDIKTSIFNFKFNISLFDFNKNTVEKIN